MSRRVVLTYPPVSSVWHLPMGIAYLAGVLGRAGHQVVQRYAHIDGVEYLLRREGGGAADRALAVVRDPAASVLDLHAARLVLEAASRAVATDDTFVVERNNVRYVAAGFGGRVAELVRILEEPDRHLFHPYLAREEVAWALRERPDVYGVSISDERQLVAGCVLAALVKAALPGTLVVMGGNYWARVRDAFADPYFGRLFRHWDAIVHAEGFAPMLALVEGAPPAKVPGVAWRDREDVRWNPPAVPVAYDDLPTPVFERGTRQWSPDFVPPFHTMSNCPMQCSFCSIAAGSDTFLGRPRAMSEARLAEHIVATSARRIDVVDELLPIARQLRLGEELRRAGWEATWQCYLTIGDRLLDPAVTGRLYEAGCRSVQLGLESLDPRTLASEAKTWNHPASYGRILRNLREAGIQVHAFIIVGCPGEPIHRSLRWLAFLEEHGDAILTIKSSRYRLTRRSPDEGRARRGALPGIRLVGDDELPLSLNHDQFAYTDGLSHKRVDAIRDLLEEACRRHWAYQVTSTIPWWINRGRYTLGELASMARQLAASAPSEPGLPDRDLARALTKVSSALRDEVGWRSRLVSYEDAAAASRQLVHD